MRLFSLSFCQLPSKYGAGSAAMIEQPQDGVSKSFPFIRRPFVLFGISPIVEKSGS
jgi:hypothetical protein